MLDRQSPDARHLFCHLAPRGLLRSPIILSSQHSGRCAGDALALAADVPHCAFSPFFCLRLRHIIRPHVDCGCKGIDPSLLSPVQSENRGHLLSQNPFRFCPETKKES